MGELCTKAFPNSSTEANVCNLLCDAAGVYTFIKLLNKISGKIDTIYFCEELKLCPVHDGGAVQIDSISVDPPTGPQGTKFAIELTFTVLNQTGTGEIVVDILPPDGMPLVMAPSTRGLPLASTLASSLSIPSPPSRRTSTPASTRSTLLSVRASAVPRTPTLPCTPRARATSPLLGSK